MRGRAALLIFVCLCVCSCKRSGEKQVAVIPKGTSSVFWQSVHAGALAAGEKYHLRIIWDAPPQETDYSRQIEILDSMIARHLDGIAIAASERDALNHSLDRAAEEHIPVTVFDSGCPLKTT